MTLASKYEILEPVTTGSVETFVARILATDERVLVHIIECPEQRPDQTTVQWVLESFQAIALEPPGLVLATGTYSGTTYAYLVTKLPESAALDAWVRSYQARQEAPAAAQFPGTASPQQLLERSVGESPRAIPAAALLTPGQEVSARTSAASRDADACSMHDDTAPSEHDEAVLLASGSSEAEFDVAKVEQQEPGEFTRQFFSGPTNQLDPVGQASLSVSPLESVPPAPSMPSTDKVLDSKPAENPLERAMLRDVPAGFRKVIPRPVAHPKEASAQDDSFPSHEASPSENLLKSNAPENDYTKTGEFTSFFQGPFHGERPAHVPPASNAWVQPKDEAGEFTKVFGPSGKTPALQEISSPHFDGETSAVRGHEENSGLLGSAKLPEPQARPAQNAEILDLNRNESAASSEPSSYVSAPPQASDPPLPSEAFTSGGAWHEADAAFVFRPQREAATNAFTARETEAGPAQGNLESGPSEFTRIVSGGIRNLESVEEPPDAAGQQDFLDRLGPPSFRAPALPSQVPQAPAFPQTFLPPARTPALPQTPQLEAAAPKVAAVPWTLILILNGLFLVAVLLVLYFALKR